jgi:hypothetical protein
VSTVLNRYHEEYTGINYYGNISNKMLDKSNKGACNTSYLYKRTI